MLIFTFTSRAFSFPSTQPSYEAPKPAKKKGWSFTKTHGFSRASLNFWDMKLGIYSPLTSKLDDGISTFSMCFWRSCLFQNHPKFSVSFPWTFPLFPIHPSWGHLSSCWCWGSLPKRWLVLRTPCPFVFLSFGSWKLVRDLFGYPFFRTKTMWGFLFFVCNKWPCCHSARWCQRCQSFGVKGSWSVLCGLDAFGAAYLWMTLIFWDDVQLYDFSNLDGVWL